jgi:hypothetical protein
MDRPCRHQPMSVMAGQATCRWVRQPPLRCRPAYRSGLLRRSRWRGTASGSACAFLRRDPEIMEIAEIFLPRGGCWNTGFPRRGRECFSAISHYLGILCANSGRNAGTDVSNESAGRSTSPPNSWHRSYGVICSKAKRDPTRDPVRGYGLSVIAPTSISFRRPCRVGDPLVSPPESA